MKEVIYLVTWNPSKLASAKKCIEDSDLDIDIQMLDFDAPEIQSFDNKEIAVFSAKYVAEKSGKPVILSDVWYFFHGLNDFPWPYVKWMNHWFSAEQILKLMENVQDRSFTIKEAIAFCRPGEEPVVFQLDVHWTIAHQAQGTGSAVDQIGIIDWEENVVALMDPQKKLAMRARNNPLLLFLEWYAKQ